jgi:hypothetical protein
LKRGFLTKKNTLPIRSLSKPVQVSKAIFSRISFVADRSDQPLASHLSATYL